MYLISVKKSVNHPVVQQSWRWCQNSSYMRVMWIWITDNFKWNTSHSNHLVGPALIIRKPFLELPFFFGGRGDYIFAKVPFPTLSGVASQNNLLLAITSSLQRLPCIFKSLADKQNNYLLLQSSAPSTFIVMSNFHRFKVLHKWWRWLRDSYLQTMPT